MLISSVLCCILSIINGVVNDKVIRFINLQFLVLRSILSEVIRGQTTGNQREKI